MLTTESAARKDRTSGNSAKLEHRHFAFIAATLAGCKPDLDSAPVGDPMMRAEFASWRNIVDQFSDACEATNPRFDRSRFLTASGATS